MWSLVEKLSWKHIMEQELQENGDPNKLVKKGLGISQGLISDLFDSMWQENEIPNAVIERFPSITKEDFNAAMTAIKLILTAVQWDSALNEVECNGNLNQAKKNKMIGSYKRKLKEFRINAKDYS